MSTILLIILVLILVGALPTWPLRYAPKRATYPLKLELKNRMLLDCICWAYLPKESRMNDCGEHEVVFLSFVGSQKKLKAGWATLMDSKREMMRLPTPPANDFDNPAPILARRCAGNLASDLTRLRGHRRGRGIAETPWH